MQDPNEDTEWNDILRSKGILPPKEKEITENDVISLVEQTVMEKQGNKEKTLDKLTLDELDEMEDEEDERVLLEYRKKRIAEMKALAEKERFGSVIEITAKEYIKEVNQAGDGVWVVVLLYKPGHPFCSLINAFITRLAEKFPATKFIRSISSLCVPNYPDCNLPSIFIYLDGELKKQIVGSVDLRGTQMSCDEFEWVLAQAGAVETELLEDPRPGVQDLCFTNLSRHQKKTKEENSDDDDDDDFS